ncbi:MAG: hypothetical protein N0E59_02020 [Candidatus Thiodiazotropha taylori]|nr:hypothetical protein [Candidatus Thiodiazotropha taylori]MCG8092607.1 hypothetical protein [Candidatus Thiodiazotropha endolucinida]MCG8109518.1 hypothetical protein [Candidatus Thiodiazotropha taylori]MCW4281859.1 hypothetical protein [Candidatus Thiodiazotropha taylori]MCW4305947.1 hypothetical protein [Candidatus Thiodiazotropha taylori]
MTDYLYYWKMDEVKTYIHRNETLDYAASKQFVSKGVNLNDTIWLVTSLGLNLELVGKLTVSNLVSRSEAEGILNRRGLFGDESWTYAINADRGTRKIFRVDITRDSESFEFVDRKGNPSPGINVQKACDPNEKRFTFGQALQSMRRISSTSAAILDARISI